MLTDDGPRVLDFGIAYALEGSQLTAPGVVVGTPGFTAPEQLVTGERVHGACDVFALGAVLVAASGGSAFGVGQALALAYRVVAEEPDVSAVPGALRPAVRACLHRNPDRRPSPARLLEVFTATGADAPRTAPPHRSEFPAPAPDFPDSPPDPRPTSRVRSPDPRPRAGPPSLRSRARPRCLRARAERLRWPRSRVLRPYLRRRAPRPPAAYARPPGWTDRLRRGGAARTGSWSPTPPPPPLPPPAPRWEHPEPLPCRRRPQCRPGPPRRPDAGARTGP